MLHLMLVIRISHSRKCALAVNGYATTLEAGPRMVNFVASKFIKSVT